MQEANPFPITIYPLLLVEKTYEGYSARVEGIPQSAVKNLKYKQEAIDQAISLARTQIEQELAAKGFGGAVNET